MPHAAPSHPAASTPSPFGPLLAARRAGFHPDADPLDLDTRSALETACVRDVVPRRLRGSWRRAPADVAGLAAHGLDRTAGRARALLDHTCLLVERSGALAVLSQPYESRLREAGWDFDDGMGRITRGIYVGYGVDLGDASYTDLDLVLEQSWRYPAGMPDGTTPEFDNPLPSR